MDPYPPLCDVKGCYTAQVAGWAGGHCSMGAVFLACSGLHAVQKRWAGMGRWPCSRAPAKETSFSALLVTCPPLSGPQYEHTLYLHPTRKEVLSRGDDY